MITQIEQLIENNKGRLKRLEEKIKLAKNEYNEALMQGMIDQLEMSIYDLETLLKENKQKEIEKSWANNPDRMGGQFTNEEILDSMRNEGW